MKLDGGSVDGNPFKATVPRDGSLHQLETTQDGFDTEKRTLNFGADIDLNGLTFGKSLDTTVVINDAACRPVTAGSLVLIAHSDDPSLNGDLPTPDWVGKISLTNDNSNLVVGVDNQRTMLLSELDAVSWTTTADGKSRFAVRGMFQFDAGTYAQTLEREGDRVLLIDGDRKSVV
mgnify:CR=1 FL=1